MRIASISAFAFISLAAAAGAAYAQGRPSTLGMSCAESQATVERSGAIVLSTGQFTFDRFVRDRSFCSPDEITVPTWAPTRDNRQCMVGYRCESMFGRAPTPR